MQNQFRRHQKVILLVDPSKEYIEYEDGFEDTPIKKGALGEINIILPNGKYHVRILDKKGNAIAYVPLDEQEIKSAE